MSGPSSPTRPPAGQPSADAWSAALNVLQELSDDDRREWLAALRGTMDAGTGWTEIVVECSPESKLKMIREILNASRRPRARRV